jgi:DNA repair ATPase RecN
MASLFAGFLFLQNSMIKKSNAALKDDIADINKTISDIQKEDTALKEKISSFEKETAGLQSEKDKLTAANSELNDKLKTMTDEYAALKKDYDKLLVNMVTFFGTVPTVPNALRGIKEPDEVNFTGGFDKMCRVLNDIGREYGNKAWLKASDRFEEGAVIVSEITNTIVDYLIGVNDKMNELPELFTKVMEIMTDGFILLGK